MTLEQILEPLGSGLGHTSPTAFAITFLGGVVASAVCPCTLPVGLGVAGLAATSEGRLRHSGLQIALAFFAGIVVSLAVLGAFAGRLGALATEAFGRNWALAMAIMSFAGAVLALQWPRMKIDDLTSWRTPGVVGTFGYSIIFSLGTSVAPLLLLLTIAAAQGPEHGLMLAFVFGLGRGLPFLLAGLAGGAITGFTRLGSWGRAVQITSAAALLLVGIYYASLFVELL